MNITQNKFERDIKIQQNENQTSVLTSEKRTFPHIATNLCYQHMVN